MRRALVALTLALAFASAAPAQDADDERARTRAEADAGDVEAAFMLGRMYRDGVGGAEDAAEARVWLKKAADAGHVRASVLLGLMLMAGQGGDADFAAARPFLLFAAAAGDEDGLYAMGLQFMEAPPRVWPASWSASSSEVSGSTLASGGRPRRILKASRLAWAAGWDRIRFRALMLVLPSAAEASRSVKNLSSFPKIFWSEIMR